MLKMRDLGINALPRGSYRMGGHKDKPEDCADQTDVQDDCNGCTATADDRRCGEYSARIECEGCTATGKPDRYHAAGFTDDTVALLRQQLDDRIGPRLGY